jgi:hypothetical protein
MIVPSVAVSSEERVETPVTDETGAEIAVGENLVGPVMFGLFGTLAVVLAGIAGDRAELPQAREIPGVKPRLVRLRPAKP